MKDSVYRISLDINEHGSQAVLKAKNTDTGRKIYISLRAGGMPYTIENDCYAAFAATKPDGSILLNNCDIVDNEIIYEFTEQTCAAIGRYRCEIKLYGPDNKLITSPRFALLVDGTVYPDGRVESTSEFSALTQLISDTTKAIDEANAAATLAKDYGNVAWEKAKDANSAAALAYEARDKATEASEWATGAAQAAEDQAKAAGEMSIRALNAADLAEQKADKADQAATNVVNIVKNAMAIGEIAGESLYIDDAVELGFVGLRIFGKTTQDGTPTPDAPVDLVSVENPTIAVNEQSMVVPHTLHGIPVSSGGNYTDANGQQWVCDEVDFGRGVYVRRVIQKIFDGSSDEQWWRYARDGSEGFVRNAPDMPVGAFQAGCCDSLQVHYSNNTNIGIWFGVDNNLIYVHNAVSIANDVDGWNAWLSNNPITVQHILATPSETTLSEEELAAYASLHTSRGITTVSNDAGAHMDVRYVMDGKIYIDRKVASSFIYPATIG